MFMSLSKSYTKDFLKSVPGFPEISKLIYDHVLFLSNPTWPHDLGHNLDEYLCTKAKFCNSDLCKL